VVDTKIVAEYYSRSGYFSTLADNILKSEGFVPTRREYTKMVENKYAQKVLDAHRADPKFDVNQVVQIRSTLGKNIAEHHLRHFRHRRCFVLANDLPIKNSTAGAKRYSLLPMGSSDVIELDEKHLMKPNRKGKTS
jgi:SNF2 family DNA or RNA helicase